MGSCRSNLERLHLFAAGLDVNHRAGLHAERRTIHELTINQDVTMHDHLTSLSSGAGKTRAHHQGVETHLEELDEVFTGKTLCLTSFFEDATQLGFTDSVLSP